MYSCNCTNVLDCMDSCCPVFRTHQLLHFHDYSCTRCKCYLLATSRLGCVCVSRCMRCPIWFWLKFMKTRKQESWYSSQFLRLSISWRVYLVWSWNTKKSQDLRCINFVISCIVSEPYTVAPPNKQLPSNLKLILLIATSPLHLSKTNVAVSPELVDMLLK